VEVCIQYSSGRLLTNFRLIPAVRTLKLTNCSQQTDWYIMPEIQPEYGSMYALALELGGSDRMVFWPIQDLCSPTVKKRVRYRMRPVLSDVTFS
jgi:hypothetical protein